MDDEQRGRRGAEWAEEGKPAPDVDPRVMTHEDLLGRELGDFLTWAREREEPWTPKAVARELVLQQRVATEEDLDELKRAVARDANAASARRADWIRVGDGRDPKLKNAIEISRLDSLMQAFDELEWHDVEEARDELGAR